MTYGVVTYYTHSSFYHLSYDLFWLFIVYVSTLISVCEPDVIYVCVPIVVYACVCDVIFYCECILLSVSVYNIICDVSDFTYVYLCI
jgi:hypothetical protein